MLIGWLGRDASFRGQHVGSMLLADAITHLAAAPVGIHAICADAIDDAVATLYRVHQFLPFVSRPNALYLPMKTALTLVAQNAGKGAPAGSAQTDQADNARRAR